MLLHMSSSFPSSFMFMFFYKVISQATDTYILHVSSKTYDVCERVCFSPAEDVKWKKTEEHNKLIANVITASLNDIWYTLQMASADKTKLHKSHSSSKHNQPYIFGRGLKVPSMHCSTFSLLQWMFSGFIAVVIQLCFYVWGLCVHSRQSVFVVYLKNQSNRSYRSANRTWLFTTIISRSIQMF